MRMSTTKSSEMTTKCTQCGGNGWIVVRKPASLYYGDGNDGVMVDFASPCPSCNGGAVVVDHRKKKANLPSAFYDVVYEDFNWNEYIDEQGRLVDTAKQQRYVGSFLRDFQMWKERGIGLYIWSRTKGSGKTFLASALCNTLIRTEGVKPKFVSVAELIPLAKSANGDKYATSYEADPIRELIDAELLVLDDLGQNSAAFGWLSDILFRICDSRMQRRAVTIVTSNMKIKELNIDQRISDRLNRMLQMIPLPEYCVREKEANSEKIDLFTSLGLMRQKVVDPEPEPEQLTIGGL